MTPVWALPGNFNSDMIYRCQGEAFYHVRVSNLQWHTPHNTSEMTASGFLPILDDISWILNTTPAWGPLSEKCIVWDDLRNKEINIPLVFYDSLYIYFGGLCFGQGPLLCTVQVRLLSEIMQKIAVHWMLTK